MKETDIILAPVRLGVAAGLWAAPKLIERVRRENGQVAGFYERPQELPRRFSPGMTGQRYDEYRVKGTD